jgi:hypothetical protein
MRETAEGAASMRPLPLFCVRTCPSVRLTPYRAPTRPIAAMKSATAAAASIRADDRASRRCAAGARLSARRCAGA